MSQSGIIIARPDLAELDDHTIELLSKLTSPKYQCCLRSLNPSGISSAKVMAVTATLDGQPVGLILSSLFPTMQQLEMHSIAVLSAGNFSKKEVAGLMLDFLDNEVKQEKGQLITYVYATNDCDASWIEAIMREKGWLAPQLFSIHCVFDPRRFDPPWIHGEMPLPNGFEEFPWSELTLKERNRLLHREQRGNFPAYISPFKDENLIELKNSLGLRYKDEVVGWMIIHRMNSDTIQYRSLYVDKEFQALGVALRLLRDSIRLHIDADASSKGLIEVVVNQVDKTWLAFVRRRLEPYAIEVSFKKQILRTL